MEIKCPSEGEEKFWLEPTVALAENHGLKRKQLGDARRIVEERRCV